MKKKMLIKGKVFVKNTKFKKRKISYKALKLPAFLLFDVLHYGSLTFSFMMKVITCHVMERKSWFSEEY